MTTLAISVPEWVVKEVIGNKAKNRSARVLELVIKGYMSEQREELNRQNNADGKALSEIPPRDVKAFFEFTGNPNLEEIAY